MAETPNSHIAKVEQPFKKSYKPGTRLFIPSVETVVVLQGGSVSSLPGSMDSYSYTFKAAQPSLRIDFPSRSRLSPMSSTARSTSQSRFARARSRGFGSTVWTRMETLLTGRQIFLSRCLPRSSLSPSRRFESACERSENSFTVSRASRSSRRTGNISTSFPMTFTGKMTLSPTARSRAFVENKYSYKTP